MRWLAAATVTLALHYAWEMLQAPLYSDFAGMTFREHALPCLQAALGDLAIAAASYGVAAWLVSNASWPFQPPWRMGLAIFVACALTITIAFEFYAISTGRWSYGPRMPTIAGVALVPLLQWIVIPSLTLLVLQNIPSLRRL